MWLVLTSSRLEREVGSYGMVGYVRLIKKKERRTEKTKAKKEDERTRKRKRSLQTFFFFSQQRTQREGEGQEGVRAKMERKFISVANRTCAGSPSVRKDFLCASFDAKEGNQKQVSIASTTHTRSESTLTDIFYIQYL